MLPACPPTVHYEISWFPIPYSFILLNFIRFFQKTTPWCGVNFLQNRFHIEHGFLSYAKVAFLKVIAKFILPFFCIVHELDILYINRRHHYNKKEKMELFFCIVFDLHYLCRRKSGTRQSESKLSLRSFALSLNKKSCTRQSESELSLRSFAFSLHPRIK